MNDAMVGEFTILLGRQWLTFTILLMGSIIISLAWMVLRAPPGKRSATVDVSLAALIGAVIMSRLFHVGLQWAYFVDNTDQILRLNQGGFDWHGALIGGLCVAWLFSHRRKDNFMRLLDSAALTVPLIGWAAWRGCAASSCAYGVPVSRMADYPPLLTWEARNIFDIIEPRFATQRLGMVLMCILLLFAVLLIWRNCLQGRRFWLIILLLSAGMFAIGFLRADYALVVNNLRLDQWLDIVMVIVSAFALLFPSLRYQKSA